MIRVLVSACLLGEKVRYNGGAATADDAILRRWVDEGRVVPFCPEVAGGLGVPRPPAEIQGGDGRDVLAGRARIATRDGRDVTAAFLTGARAASDAAAAAGDCRLAILKSNSPSCGSATIYDGTFTGALRPGPGATAALLAERGLAVFSEADLGRADAWLRAAEAGEGA